MEFSKKSLDKKPSEKLIYSICKHMNINPFTKKVNNKVSKTTNQFINKIIEPDKNRTKKIVESQKNIEDIKRSLEKFDVPNVDVETLLSDLNRIKDCKGVMEFDFGAGLNTYQNEQVLILGPSKSGKSYLIVSLLLELKQSFNHVCLLTGRESYNNIAAQTLKIMCEKAGILFTWFSTDKDCPIEYCEDNMSVEDYIKKYKNDDGSVSKLYSNNFGSVYVFEDLYTKAPDSHIFKFIEDCSIKGRHKKISFFINYQSYTRLSSKILDNLTKIFIFRDFLQRDDIFKKLRIPEPSNLNEIIHESEEEKSRFYYLDDDMLLPFNNYSYTSKNQIISKLKSKIPVGCIDKKKKKIYDEKIKLLKQLEQEEQDKIAQNKKADNNNDPLKEKESVNGIPIEPKQQKQLVGKTVSNDSLKIKPTSKNVNFDNNKINTRLSRFTYNFINPP